jgi:hypothetical protein
MDDMLRVQIAELRNSQFGKSCLYSSPLPANSSMRNIRFSLWKKQSENVRVSEVLLDLNLAADLLLDARLDDFRLVQTFERENVCGFRISSEPCTVHATEFALVEWSTDVEVG